MSVGELSSADSCQSKFGVPGFDHGETPLSVEEPDIDLVTGQIVLAQVEEGQQSTGMSLRERLNMRPQQVASRFRRSDVKPQDTVSKGEWEIEPE